MSIQIDPNTSTLHHVFTQGEPDTYFEALNCFAEMVKAVRRGDEESLALYAHMAAQEIEALLDDEDVIATFPHGADLLVAA